MDDNWCWKGCCTHQARVAWCFCFVVVAFILDVIGFSVPYWYYKNTGVVKMYEGLWKRCNEIGDVISCEEWVDIDSTAWFKANQAMQTIGMIFLLVAVVLLFLLLICYKRDYKIRLVTICFLAASAVFILVGAIIYGAESSDMVTDNLNFGFVFVVVAASLAIVGALCLCLGIDKSWENGDEE